ncbi:hypothetical protein SMSP2_01944 [Limihaloglobus sulfuriphilus]|uniref:Ice-binding protein C-terminal domain-containing protein n=1 Tax=Limihaloglobus sulfuriphilus TaxID=1851148 RepID=A0A1Q2MG86_9BACT|nr:PEP-CTERM sorting domain-containing protein [Limihaloglobus sulfuriphilus]AQQ71568.1 hypothetical protein SMSP2_01944 [Limihaloglobus sulfuriphilus]
MKMMFELMVVVLILSTGLVSGEYFNIDFGNTGWNQAPGIDWIPSNTFGAAANQPGEWYCITGPSGSSSMTDITGNNVPVGYSLNVYNQYTGTNYSDSDMGHLFKDYVSTLSNYPWDFTVRNLQNGTYNIYLYAPERVGISTGDLDVNGVMVSDFAGDNSSSLIESVNWKLATVEVTDGNLSVVRTKSYAVGGSGLSGLQIAPVPEPGTMILFAGCGLLLRRKIK